MNNAPAWIFSALALVVLAAFWTGFASSPEFWGLMMFFIPLGFLAWCALFLFSDRKREADVYPLGDATETPTTLRDVRRCNGRK